MWKDIIKAKETTSPFTERVETKSKKRTSDRAKREEKKKRNILNKYPKDINKGEEIHPSVKGHQDNAKHKFRQEMIKLKQRLKPLEEEFKTKEVQDNKYMKEEYADKIDSIKRRIKRLSKETGASFSEKETYKDQFTGKEYKNSISQRLSPSTKKPSVKRMKRPDPFPTSPNEKDMDKVVMRRFGITEVDWEKLSFKDKSSLLHAYYIDKKERNKG